MSHNGIRTWLGTRGERAPGTRVPKDYVLWGALGCVLVGTAHAEYTLTVATGVHPWVAASVPGALDLYVIRALQVRRDVFLAVLAMVGVNVVSHLVTAGVLAMDWRIVSAVGALAPLILWRIHSLWYLRSRTRSEVLWDAPAPAEYPARVPQVPEYLPEVSGVPGGTCEFCGHAKHETDDLTPCTHDGCRCGEESLDVPPFMREAQVPEYEQCAECGEYVPIVGYPVPAHVCVPEVPETEPSTLPLPEGFELEVDESLHDTMSTLYRTWSGRQPGPGIKAIKTACKVSQNTAYELQKRYDREYGVVRPARHRKEGTP